MASICGNKLSLSAKLTNRTTGHQVKAERVPCLPSQALRASGRKSVTTKCGAENRAPVSVDKRSLGLMIAATGASAALL